MSIRSTQRSHAVPPRAARGFVLVLTLWIIALFGLGVAAINTWVSSAIENARVLKSRIEGELVLSNFKNEVVYAFATRPVTSRGLEVGDGIARPHVDDLLNSTAALAQSSQFVAFDRRPYVIESDPNYIVQIQDGRGLINLNRITPQLLRRLLALYDAPETLRNQLPDTLQDWIDEDELTRLAGAEFPDYERRRRIPPSNARLITPMEAQNILGWDEIPQMWEDDLKAPLFSTCSSNGFNPNTAPEIALLTHMPGITEDAAKYVIEERQRTAFRQPRDFMEAANISTPAEAFFFGITPGNCMIIDLVNRTTSDRVRLSLTIVARSEYQPWQVDYVIRIPSQYSGALDGLNPQLTFPAPETLYSSIDGTDGVPRLQ